jgi:hypothetical protein
MMAMINWFMSDPMNIVWAIINSLFVFATMYYTFYTMRQQQNLIQNTFIVFVLFSLSILTCPIIDQIFEHTVSMALKMGG